MITDLLSTIGMTKHDWLIGSGITLLIVVPAVIGVYLWDKLKDKIQRKVIDVLEWVFLILYAFVFFFSIAIFVPVIVFSLSTLLWK